ncbi:NAD(P)-dependent oxidoreductase [Shewanella inventionis]|uniref:NAD-dependent epimerase n=1 Tax=Shewanella inventionis TaxID=1738770 RepID=A0ABQ1JID5_9GAMM|nr:NAD(P)-dependent oxidoreductase [Shewanella inventionis]MCL1158257.1 NAD(P)-dependent oxidoreductase [Shewanella inventionis]UAL42806.1 NAD(P)-dependent oxidoreductase [Shewanella inventionis]GGB67068.1 NAD-dependent epimerase [Shewanella inventionis]
MRILVTGSAGRVGRAIYIKLMRTHDVVGIDKTPCSTADYIGDIRDSALIGGALENIDVIIHTAALHAPHVGLVPDSEFQSINVDATEKLALAGVKAGIKHFIFTSTTALYGYASTPKGIAGWVNEQVTPQPKSIYHKSKIAAETKLEEISKLFQLPVTVLQMSRCFPEPADLMAVFRLTRGIDARDVANAHLCAAEKRLSGFNRFIISGRTPFHLSDCQALYTEAGSVIKRKCPEIALAFRQRNWQLPQSLDRVYDSSSAHDKLGWSPIHGFESVLEMLDTETAEVLPMLKPRKQSN